MAYSVIVWLVEPGEQPYEAEERELSADRQEAPGARSGSNVAPALPRMTYGVYDSQSEADSALQQIGDLLRENRPLKIDSKAHRVFLVPAHRVHYVVCEEVERPMDG
ncbi:hypothetical protein [Rubrobacter aplysinae]|uniref:hypothetical protein n=1 Tax=Rubrobacter aplysinae TaxID=909625 RepID=UPI00064BBB82|nr:hypothetical protein [Rubrobacter aplysinae]